MGLDKKPNQDQIENKIRNMRVGETGYIGPASVLFDKDNNPYLDTNQGLRNHEPRMEQLPITRTGSGKADYDIGISQIVRYQWNNNYLPQDECSYEAELSTIVKLDYNQTIKPKLNQEPEQLKLRLVMPDNGKINNYKMSPENEMAIAKITQDYERCAELRDENKNVDLTKTN